ncbi:hypothetical protein jaqu_02070 [Jannaschia aquimarina]|uniref:Uncharacterized protein n=1 Tax=Jannaschia aquimarina TaxID=935700 RepID=A0A0D1CTI3_9RHOB|nr:hypothetical protein [Jannaschia aquimarina]KIT18082.1 hypothetical protein jaqu_02070 [Jannaschia aquimarina]SNS90007.1 hypothetical protein SAMN05421775_103233 [Jannaschia aquimarina]
MVDLPPYYFRVKDNGALVFRVDTENRQRRLELDQIATININNGNVKPQGDRELTQEDRAAIDAWMTARSDELASREVDDILRAVDTLNLTAHWAQARATDEQLEAVTDRLLLAMHDLRTVLVRKRADRVLGKGG